MITAQLMKQFQSDTVAYSLLNKLKTNNYSRGLFLVKIKNLYV